MLRLARLYLVSRRVPAALGLLAGARRAAVGRAALALDMAGGPAARQFIPLTIETGAAAVIAVTTYGPFGETERAAGRWLPWLRLGAALPLTAVAFGALAAGAARRDAGRDPGPAPQPRPGWPASACCAAAVLGGAFGWTGPMAYLLITEGALAGSWTTPWVWPTRPPHDLGGALCACGVFAAGVAAITLLGARDPARRPGPE